MSKKSTPAPRPPGRPRKYEDGTRTSILLPAEDLAELRSFCRWYGFRHAKDLSIGQAILEVLRASDAWRDFRRAQK